MALKLRGGGDSSRISEVALGLRGGGGASHLSDVAIYGGASLLLIDGAIEYVYPELALVDSKDSDGIIACRHDGLWRAALATALA